MSRLVQGQWTEDWKPADDNSDGRFVRKDSGFRGTIPAGAVEAGRYHLYVAWTCPWAHRTLLARSLKGLQERIPVHFCNELSDRSWRFVEGPESLYGKQHLFELYLKADPHYTGRVTVPVLWDSHTHTVINNESSDIMQILDAIPSDAPSLAPAELEVERVRFAELLYEPLNNGVYRAGFAQAQSAYDAAAREVFATLDLVERHLEGREWLVGDRITESDIRLFVTLFRFDPAYYTLFKCNLRRIADYPNLQSYLDRVLKHPGVAETCNLKAMKQGYASIRAINPYGIVPMGPGNTPAL